MGDTNPSSGSGDDAHYHTLTTKLIDEFRTRLDDTLIIAIISDHNLTEEYSEAHSTLTSLAQNVPAEEASVYEQGFLHDSDEPNNTNQGGDLAGLNWTDSPETSQDTTNSARILSDSSSSNDWNFSLSDRFAGLELPKDVNVATLDEEGKIEELKIMFPGMNDMDLKFTLKKSKGDFPKACEELLNLQYLEENGLRLKGIEGAFHDERMADFSSRSSTPREKDKGKNRLDVNYHLTPINLSEGDAEATPKTALANRLGRRNSLPRIFTSQTAVAKSAGSAPISPATKPTDWQTVKPKKKTYTELASEATASRALANQTLEAANTAYRRGKSDVLYRPVAGVLAEQAKEQRARARRIEAEQHEAYVDRTASSGSIDLHGVPVLDGVRIALQRTQAWWVNLGENRHKKAREQGFVVVTGLGKHSASGVSRLRQEVGAALKREGWRVSNETGQFVVLGKA